MRDIRKSLEKHLYETFRQQRIPYLMGIKGIGKHFAIEAFCKKYHYSYEIINNKLPENKDTVYIYDQFDNKQFNQKLFQLLEKENYKICFISEELPVKEMYAIMTWKIELFSANEFLFTYSDCKTYVKKTIDEIKLKEIYKQSQGNIFILQYLLRYSQKEYLEEYVKNCIKLLNEKEKECLMQLAMFERIEKELIFKGYHMEKDIIETLCLKGFLIEEKLYYKIPSYFHFLNNTNHSRQAYEYYMNKKFYVKAYRYAKIEDKKKLYEKYGIQLILLLKEKELYEIENIESFFLMKCFRCFRLQKQNELKQLIDQRNECDEAYMLAKLLLEDINIEEWILTTKSKGIKIHIPVQLFLNGFLKSRLFLGHLMMDKELYEKWIQVLDEESIKWMSLLQIEDAIENHNLIHAERLMKKCLINKEDELEICFIKNVLLIRYFIIAEYKEELLKLPDHLIEEIKNRDDELTYAMELFKIEKAIIFNQQTTLSKWYMTTMNKESMNPYEQLLNVSMLYRMKLYEKSMAKTNQLLINHTYNEYIVSHLNYVYALNLNALHKETKALKMLSLSLLFNGPLRYSSYYSYFGKETIELMKIYIRFLNKGLRKTKKKYLKAIESETKVDKDYHDYIEDIIKNAKQFISVETEIVNDLTPQENRIIHYIEKGYTNLQIAEAMEIRIPTVKTHISNLYVKLGVNNRSSAIKVAKKNGYLL